MKKFLSIVTLIIVTVLNSQAQWSGTTDISNTNSGKVGIGTAGTSPVYKFEVKGVTNDFKARIGGSDGYIDFGPANTSYAHIYTDRPVFLFNKNIWSVTGGFSSYPGTDLSLQTNGSTWMTISNTTGNVGIRTTNPTANLQVGEGTGNSLINLGGYATLGSLRSSGDFFAGMNAYAQYGSATENSKIKVLNSNTYGFSALQMSYTGDINFYAKAGAVTANDQINLSQNAKMTILGNGNVGIGNSTPQNVLQIGPNPQGWNGNDLAISNANANGNEFSIGVTSTYTQLYGALDIALRPGFGKWSVYSKGSNGYVGIGHNAPSSMLHVLQSNNTDWAAYIQNTGGTGKGLRVQCASGDATPALQVDDGNGNNRFLVRSDGNVGIGTISPDAQLAVKGTVHANEVKVDLNVPGPDYVFEKDYHPLSLEEIKAYIEKNKHLPEVPSAKEMETNGINLSEMNMLLLKKIEELTLLLVNQNDTMEYLKSEIKNQNKEIELLKKQIK